MVILPQGWRCAASTSLVVAQLIRHPTSRIDSLASCLWSRIFHRAPHCFNNEYQTCLNTSSFTSSPQPALVPGAQAAMALSLSEPGIYGRTRKAILAFDKARRSHEDIKDTGVDHRSQVDFLQDASERFLLWCGNQGALHPLSDPRSLEHRLRDNLHVSKRVQELLNELVELLNVCK